MSIEKALKGDRSSLARLITRVENNPVDAREILSAVAPLTGRAHVIGITGATGSGKSSLVNGLIGELRGRRKKVGVIAIDPTSPFSGGAFLGDRIRMGSAGSDKHVFIRSMASRGGQGGLSRVTSHVIKLLDACGKDAIIVETAGAGQLDVEIANIVDTVIVVATPEGGDDIQIAKAGIMEIGDIFVVNKADFGEADSRVSEIKTMILSLFGGGNSYSWVPDVVKTIAVKDKGLNDLFMLIQKHYSYLRKTNLLSQKRRDRKKSELVEAVKELVVENIIQQVTGKATFDSLLEKVVNNDMDVYLAADSLLRQFKKTKCY